jgi:DNA modification methylase
VSIIHGDCLEVMAGMEPESVDAIVCDPPYGLEFMGKEWDKLGALTLTDPSVVGGFQDGNGGNPFSRSRVRYGTNAVTMQAWHQQWAEAAYRVAKPSAYLLAFGGTRTVHRMTVALEDAGWIIRDMLVWGYASGFPKSKASLKPAWEPIVMARKPGPLRMLAIDECRIPTTEAEREVIDSRSGGQSQPSLYGLTAREHGERFTSEPAGRWPANIILTDPIFDGGVEGVVGGGETTPGTRSLRLPAGRRRFDGRHYAGGEEYLNAEDQFGGYDDSGTYSRFFLIPKADRADREPVLGGLTGLAPGKLDNMGDWPNDAPSKSGGVNRRNAHPTVKPTDLMRHLVRLVTPTGGTVLDPFLGSGTTGLAAEMEGFQWIGIEREAEYVRIAEARLNGTQRGLGLDVGAPTPKMPNTHPDLSKHQPKVSKGRAGGHIYGAMAGFDHRTPAEPDDEDVA